MNIAVNARMLTQWKPGGIKRYAQETLKRITQKHPEHRFLFIVDRPFPDRGNYPDNVAVARTFPSFHPLLWYPWFELAVPRLIKRFGADMFLSLDGYASLSIEIPTVTVIHDLSFYHHPQDMPRLIRNYYNKFFPQFARKAQMIATISEYSKRDICNIYGEPADKITVTFCGAGDAFRPLPEEEKIKIRAKISGGAPYFLSVGSLHPRKNLVRLIEAFEKFKCRTQALTKLILVGPSLFKPGDVFEARRRSACKEDIIFLGELPDEQIPRIYGGAQAFLFVSYFEGFGIPALEAMKCDIPVVAAARTSLPEVCGDAARLVDPFSVDEIAEAMRDVCFNEALRNHLIESGRSRREFFNWDKTADILWDTVERSLS